MKYIFGLGNPGAQYSGNYHNLGTIFANWLCEYFPNELVSKKTEYEMFRFSNVSFSHFVHLSSNFSNMSLAPSSDLSLNGSCFYVIKPNVFMNLSFKAIGSVYSMNKASSMDFLVMHDELMLPKYDIKLKIPDGSNLPGNAGHNGLRNISEHMSANFSRLRIGIDHPKNFDPRISVTNYVLSNIDDISAYKKAFETKGIKLISDWLNTSTNCVSMKK